ncbi:DUF2577 family protein [Paenibacillus aurantiacus]|uniref:DUF2577 family protein n=1 Tax=Paenibacillus aurantiacus TaxID=1936118 RepID=A0ABV5KS05_9BACL
MKDGFVELAKMFRERDNPKLITVGLATVISPLPALQLQFGEAIILEREDLVIAAHLAASAALAVGDQVIVIPTTDMQKFVAIDKVGEL